MLFGNINLSLWNIRGGTKFEKCEGIKCNPKLGVSMSYVLTNPEGWQAI